MTSYQLCVIDPQESYLPTLLMKLIAYKIPFSTTYGNSQYYGGCNQDFVSIVIRCESNESYGATFRQLRNEVRGF